jgi:dCTP deaminase
MSVLSAATIKTRLALRIGDPSSLVITPLPLDPKAFDYDSVDLRLGSHFLLPQIPPQPVAGAMQGARNTHTKVHVPLGGFLVVPSHETVLGATLEFIKMPNDVSGQILTKSSIARNFMVIETAPWVHPLYRGCLTLEIANVSNTPLVIYPGWPIGQLVLILNDQAACEEMPAGTYIGPVYPEQPPARNAKARMRAMGIEQYRDPSDGKWQSTAETP